MEILTRPKAGELFSGLLLFRPVEKFPLTKIDI
jgi:hypothetical protein